MKVRTKVMETTREAWKEAKSKVLALALKKLKRMTKHRPTLKWSWRKHLIQALARKISRFSPHSLPSSTTVPRRAAEVWKSSNVWTKLKRAPTESSTERRTRSQMRFLKFMTFGFWRIKRGSLTSCIWTLFV